MSYVIVEHTPGPRWDHSKPYPEQEGIMDHAQYLKDQFDAGRLVMAGPFKDGPGGMAIFAAELNEVAAISEDDPCVRSGLLIAKPRPWFPAIRRD